MKGDKILKLVQVDEYDLKSVKQAAEDIFNKGALRGGLAALGGMAVGAMIHYGVEHLKAKKKEGVE